MARFNIIDADSGEVKYSGKPRYNGTYCKVSYLEFVEVASPTPIEWKVGDYVVYSRTGMTYKLYDIPQPKKQSRRESYGGAFIYSNVQFYADTKWLDLEPFRDIVPADNDIHFSTRESWSVWTNVANLVDRFQAVMDAVHPGEWEFRLLDAEELMDNLGLSDNSTLEDLYDLLNNNWQDFTVSGESMLSALEKIYDQWSNIGWLHTVENGKNIITIGIPSIRIQGAGTVASGNYLYGKGKGLKSIKKYVANKEDIRTRLYVYGSTRNMIPRYYNTLTPAIKDADSVDIQHLMIPLSYWGTTDSKKDASKAYIEQNTDIYGVRPDTAYFDGEELEEIYPSIEKGTIGDVYDAMSAGEAYRPDLTKWLRTQRLDEVVAVAGISDDGMRSQNGGKYTDTQTITSRQEHTNKNEDFYAEIISAVTLSHSGRMSIDLSPIEVGIIDPNSVAQSVTVNVEVKVGNKSSIFPATWDKSGYQYTFHLPEVTAYATSGDTLVVTLNVAFTAQRSSSYVVFMMENTNLSANFSVNYPNTFVLQVPQIGFDISKRTALGSQGIATIAMRDGMCGGRSFVVQKAEYDVIDDAWNLTIYRGIDESLDMLFPNTTYHIVPGDHFVLLDIAMPDIYIRLAEQRLYNAGLALLDDISRQKSAYELNIDAEFMQRNGRSLLEGWYIALQDDDIIGEDVTEYVMMDIVTISEDESAIPTYKVSLREQKKTSYSNTGTTHESSSQLTSLANSRTNEGTSDTSFGKQNKLTEEQLAALQFFSVVEVDGEPCIKLNPVYNGLFAEGFLSANGASVGSGGTGGASTLKELNDVLSNGTVITRADGTPVQSGDVFVYNTSVSKWVAYPQNAISPDLTPYLLKTEAASTYQTIIDASHKLAASLISGLAAVATSGSYNDLSGKPTIPDHLPNPQSLTFGEKTYDGSAAKEITKSDLGLGNVENKSASDILGELTEADIYALLSAARKAAVDSGVTQEVLASINSAITTLQGRATAVEDALEERDWFAYDADKNMVYVKNAGGATGSPNDRGLFAYGNISAGGASENTGGGGGGGGDLPHVFLTQEEYDALAIKDPGTLYFTYED